MKKIIFLDIDGVLQPTSSQKRFKHDMNKLRDRLAQESDEKYKDMDKYDIAAVFYDWDPDAVNRLKTLCDKTQAEIVISSDWRSYNPLEGLKRLFKIHELDCHVIDVTEQLFGYQRDYEIEDYLIKHPDISVFAVLDDAYYDELNTRFPEQFVYCERIFDDSCYQKALGILQQTPAENTVPAPVQVLENITDNDPGVTEAQFSLDRISLVRRYYQCATDEVIRRLCIAVGKNTHIKELTISGLSCNYSYKEREENTFVAPIWDALRQNKSVTRLDLSGNSLKDISALISALKTRDCPLETLALRNNSLSDDSLDMLADYISSIRHPFSLMLQNFYGTLSAELIEAIAANPQVTVFAFYRQFHGIFFGFGKRKPVPENLKLE